MLTRLLSPTEQEIDAALKTNITALCDGFFDLFAAILLCIIAGVSLVHAGFRIVFVVVGLMLWSLALLVTFLYWLRSLAVARSSSLLHRGGE